MVSLGFGVERLKQRGVLGLGLQVHGAARGRLELRARVGGVVGTRNEPERCLRYTLTGEPAGVAKLADARDSKSRGVQAPCGFDSHLRHHEA